MMQFLERLGLEKLLLIIALVAGAVVVVLQLQGPFLGGSTPEVTPPADRKLVAPDFSLPDLQGRYRSLSDFRGSVVLLNFWATWCPPCRLEMPSMETLYQSYKDQGFVIVAVSSDVQGAAVVQPFLEEYRLSFLTLLDPTGQLNALYGVRSIPTSYLLDRRGRVVTREIGARDWANARSRALITLLLEEREEISEQRTSKASNNR